MIRALFDESRRIGQLSGLCSPCLPGCCDLVRFMSSASVSLYRHPDQTGQIPRIYLLTSNRPVAAATSSPCCAPASATWLTEKTSTAVNLVNITGSGEVLVLMSCLRSALFPGTQFNPSFLALQHPR